jgi:dTDP-4-amino-4,6-dideoxygalactose transaminase
LPVSEQMANETLSLPVHPDLTDAEVDRVIAAVLAAVR